MARIKNVDLRKDKRIVISLTDIYGIGPARAKKICSSAKVDESIRTKDLTVDQINALRKEVDNYTVGGDLKREKDMNIKRKMEINCYEGTRHKKGLPVRGQKTRSNARNCKAHKGPKKVVANKKK